MFLLKSTYCTYISGEALSAKQAANTAAAVYSLGGVTAVLALTIIWN